MPLTIALPLAALLAFQTPAAAERQSRESDVRTREIYVSAVDSRGEPVTDLTVADLTIREDGATREVLSVAPATEPLNISLLMDDTQAATQAIQYIRDGLNRFADRMDGKASMALATFGDRTTPLVEYTTSAATLKKGGGRIFARSNAGSTVLDSIIDVSRGLQRRQATRPTIVVVTTEGEEFSNASHQQVLDALAASGATLHVLFIGNPEPLSTQEARERTIAFGEGTARTGGRNDQVLALSGLPDRMDQLARELLNQYVVTYGRPDSLIPPEKIQVSTSRSGVTVRATNRAPEK